MTGKTEFERAVEKETGESVEALRDTPIDVRRRRNEKKFGRPTQFCSMFDFIGRGNVLRDLTISREEVETELDKALRS